MRSQFAEPGHFTETSTFLSEPSTSNQRDFFQVFFMCISESFVRRAQRNRCLRAQTLWSLEAKIWGRSRIEHNPSWAPRRKMLQNLLQSWGHHAVTVEFWFKAYAPASVLCSALRLSLMRSLNCFQHLWQKSHSSLRWLLWIPRSRFDTKHSDEQMVHVTKFFNWLLVSIKAHPNIPLRTVKVTRGGFVRGLLLRFSQNICIRVFVVR